MIYSLHLFEERLIGLGLSSNNHYKKKLINTTMARWWTKK